MLDGNNYRRKIKQEMRGKTCARMGDVKEHLCVQRR